MAFLEHNARSLTKTLTYRILIIVSNAAIVYILTGDMGDVLNITAITTIASTVIYFLHERAWNHIHWGKHDYIQSKHSSSL